MTLERKEGRKGGRREAGRHPQRKGREGFHKLPQHIITLKYELRYLLEHFIQIRVSVFLT